MPLTDEMRIACDGSAHLKTALDLALDAREEIEKPSPNLTNFAHSTRCLIVILGENGQDTQALQNIRSELQKEEPNLHEVCDNITQTIRSLRNGNNPSLRRIQPPELVNPGSDVDYSF